MKKMLLTVALVVGLAACGTDGQANSGAKPESITVMAASSLTGTLTQLATQYEAEHPNTKIVLNFAASSTLAQQISAGAPAQVFVSASKKSMEAAASRVQSPIDFLSNYVVLAVPAKAMYDPCFSVNPCLDSMTANVMNQENFKWIQCAHEVPCGAAADKATVADGVKTKPVSLEPDVKSVVTKMLAGEVDGAIVYHTDVIANPTLNGLEFMATKAATTTYSIGEIDSGNTLAADFITYVTGPAGNTIFSTAGFTALK